MKAIAAVKNAIADQSHGDQKAAIAALSDSVRDLAQSDESLRNILSEFEWTGTQFSPDGKLSREPGSLIALLSRLEDHVTQRANASLSPPASANSNDDVLAALLGHSLTRTPA